MKQKKQRDAKKEEKYTADIEKYIEFPYLEEMNDAEYNGLKKARRWVVVDPGKNNLIFHGR